MSRWGMRSCREAALLLTQAEYQALPVGDRAPLLVHLALCARCRRYAEQQRLISLATARWRADSGTDENGPPG